MGTISCRPRYSRLAAGRCRRRRHAGRTSPARLGSRAHPCLSHSRLSGPKRHSPSCQHSPPSSTPTSLNTHDVVVLTAPSAARRWATIGVTVHAVVAIGQPTRRAAYETGITLAATAASPDAAGIATIVNTPLSSNLERTSCLLIALVVCANLAQYAS